MEDTLVYLLNVLPRQWRIHLCIYWTSYPVYGEYTGVFAERLTPSMENTQVYLLNVLPRQWRIHLCIY